jgi:superfamily II DNA or RNA helicase
MAVAGATMGARAKKSSAVFPEEARLRAPFLPSRAARLTDIAGAAAAAAGARKSSVIFPEYRPTSRKLMAVRAGEGILDLPKSVPLRLLQPPPDIPVHLPVIVDPGLSNPIVLAPKEPIVAAMEHLEQIVAAEAAEPPKKKARKHPERPMKMPPKDFQTRLCKYMKESGLKRLLLLHGTGMGKTYSVVFAIYCLLKAMIQTKSPGLERIKRIVFVTVEANFTAFDRARAQLSREYPAIPPGNITTITHGNLIANYATKARSAERYGGSIMVVDEAHEFASSVFKAGEPSLKGKAILDATQHAEFVFLLTATPAKNKVSDFYILHKILSMDYKADKTHTAGAGNVEKKWKVKKPSLLATYRESFRYENVALSNWSGSEEYLGNLKRPKGESLVEGEEFEEGDDTSENMWFETGMFKHDSPYNLYCQISVVPGATQADPTRPVLFEDSEVLNFEEHNPQYVKEFKRVWFKERGGKQEGFKQAQRIVSLVAKIKQPLTPERREELDRAGARLPKNQKYDPVNLTVYPDKTIFSAMLAVVMAACNKKVVIYADFVENGVTMFIDLMNRIMVKMEQRDLERLRLIMRKRLEVVEPDMVESGVDVKGEYANVLRGDIRDVARIRVFSVVGGVEKGDKEAQVNGFNDEIEKVRDEEGREHNRLRLPENPDMHKIMVVSGAGGVGAEFLNVNHMIMLSPPWSTAKYLQARGRVDRTRSHEALRPDQRYLVIYKAITNVEHKGKMLSMEGIIYESLEHKEEDIFKFYSDLLEGLSIERSDCMREDTYDAYPGKRRELYWESGIEEEEGEEKGAPL